MIETYITCVCIFPRPVGTLDNKDVSGMYSTDGNAVVLDLNGGDFVQLETTEDSNFYGDPSEIYCIFSGYLLYSKSSGELIVGK